VIAPGSNRRAISSYWQTGATWQSEAERKPDSPTRSKRLLGNSRGGAFCRNWLLSSCDRGQRLISRTQSGREHVVGCVFGQGEGTCLGEGDGGLQRAHDLALHHLHPCIVESALLAKLTGEK
jgi:hypothetical protein